MQRLKVYKSKLVVFPRRTRVPKKAKQDLKDKKKAELAATKTVTQHKGKQVLPVSRASVKTRHRKITDEEKNSRVSVFQWLRKARADARLVGIRKKRAAERAAAPGAGGAGAGAAKPAQE